MRLNRTRKCNSHVRCVVIRDRRQKMRVNTTGICNNDHVECVVVTYNCVPSLFFDLCFHCFVLCVWEVEINSIKNRANVRMLRKRGIGASLIWLWL